MKDGLHMQTETWKKKLIRYAHTGKGSELPWKSKPGPQKLVLGHKIFLRKTMNPSFEWLEKIKGDIRYDELLSRFTSIRIGGPADIMIYPKDIEDLQTIFKYKSTLPHLVLGEGSNLLVSDSGFRGLVVCLKNGFKTIHTPRFYKDSEGKDKALLKVEAGVKMSYLAKTAARYSLSGIQKLVGIPGSLGGALVMNAGAEGAEIGQFIKSVTRVTETGNIQTLTRDQLQFDYRKTQFPPGGGIIVSAELELEKGDSQSIFDDITSFLGKRSNKQPLSLPNSGSVFKNPPGDTAGRLIESLGLKGFTVGDASISIKHANFIVNKGSASAKDVIQIIDHVQKTVLEKHGIELETEIVRVDI